MIFNLGEFMEIRNEDLKIRKVKITDIKVFSKNYSNVSTKHFGNDVYVNHSNYTDEHERIYYEEENGAVGMIETINEQTLFKNGGDCVVASIENRYLGYKNSKQTIEYSPLLKEEKVNVGFMSKFMYIFLFLICSMPILSFFIYFPFIKESQRMYYRPSIFKYSFIEESLFLVALSLSVILNIVLFAAGDANKDYLVYLSMLGIIGLSAFTFKKYYSILKEHEIKKETLKNKIKEEIEKIEKSN